MLLYALLFKKIYIVVKIIIYFFCQDSQPCRANIPHSINGLKQVLSIEGWSEAFFNREGW